MTKFNFHYLNNYKNHGQNAEQSIRFTLTGELAKADNLPHDKGTDCLNFQIKSERATICKGLDLDKYLEADAAHAYIYADKNGTAWVMNKEEYRAFCKTFGTVTKESQSNGGGEKIRLKIESSKMMKWLQEQ